MNIKTLALLALAVIAIANGIATQYPDPYHPSEAASTTLVVFFALATFAWFRADATQRSYRRSPFLNVAVFGLAAVALPYYFVRSRGWKQGLDRHPWGSWRLCCGLSHVWLERGCHRMGSKHVVLATGLRPNNSFKPKPLRGSA